MSAATVTVRYDGPILSDHRMDVADLAPALLGISELCKLANAKFNGDKTSLKVLIGTDVEHQCFEIKLHVLQSLWGTAKSILSNDDVGTAKAILDWLGLFGSGVTGTTYGLFRFLKWLRGRQVTSTELEVKDGRDVVRVTIDGDHNVVYVYPQAMELLRDESALANVKKVVQPLLKDGYDKVEFQTPEGVIEKIAKDDAADICLTTQSSVEVTRTDLPQPITAWVSVYAPVYDAKAKKWRFKFGDAHEYMDISETDIAQAAIKRGGVLVDDAYRVELELTQEHKSAGIANHYKIKKVLDFRPARLHYQADAFKDNSGSGAA